jgi:hypothetical protein
MTLEQSKQMILSEMKDRKARDVHRVAEAIKVYMDKRMIGFIGDYWNGDIPVFHYVPADKG